MFPVGPRLLFLVPLVPLCALWAWWVAAILPRRGISFESVAALNGLKLTQPGGVVGLAAFAAFLAMALGRRPELLNPRFLVLILALSGTSLLVPMAAPVGLHGALLAVAFFAALLIGLHGDGGQAEPQTHRDRRWALVLWVLVAALMGLFSMHRHWAFGSGSWDHGCMVHNFYRASRFLDTRSTVLGDVDFLGDHFMVGIYLYAPLIWLNSSGYTVLLIQSVNLAAVAPAVYLIARHRGVGVGPALALGLAGGLAFGLQSGAFFDSHEITVGFGFLAWGVWAFEVGKLKHATVFLILFSLFKESLGAYVVGLGLLALWRGLQQDKRLLKYGLIWILYGVVWFVLVNRVFMPTLIARGLPPEPHETFGDFGPTVFAAAQGILTHPIKALAAMVVPAEKLWAHGVTLGGLGGLALFAPEILIAALPLLAERFLSSKETMWQMGYHYAASLSLYSAWAAAVGFERARGLLSQLLQWLGENLGRHAAAVLGLHVLLAALLVNAFGYHHPSNFLRWREGYFSTAPRQRANGAAVAFLAEQGKDARLAVQNRILPHLADRPVVYRLGEWEKADWVLLSVGESAWPYDDGLPGRLARQLSQNADWRLVFAQEGTAVFARVSVMDLPGVAPTPGLGLPTKP